MVSVSGTSTLAASSSGMILASGARGPGFNSQSSPFSFPFSCHHLHNVKTGTYGSSHVVLSCIVPASLATEKRTIGCARVAWEDYGIVKRSWFIIHRLFCIVDRLLCDRPSLLQIIYLVFKMIFLRPECIAQCFKR